ncbi:MAG: phosphatidylglycerophosphatase A [Parvibaculales bacterium]
MLKFHKIPEGLSFFSPAVMVASFGGAGLIRPASGTWGSLAALPFGYFILLNYNWLYLLTLSITLYIIGLWACTVWLHFNGAGEDESESSNSENNTDNDPSAIVIDEAAGLLFALALIPYPRDGFSAVATLLLGFALFRFFDIFKPWPVRYIDNNTKGAQGIMLDDMVAGLLAALTTAVISKGFPDVP